MNEDDIIKKEADINSKYEKFLSEVSDAFNRHCDEIKKNAERKFETIPEEDEAARQQILDEEKVELDKTLAELKQLIATRSTKMREQLEEIANLRDQAEFNLDDQLADVSDNDEAHAA